MPINTVDDDFLLYQIAKMYYIDDLSQDAIAKEVGFSRSYVSRLLDKAKERRIVTFVVTNPLDRSVCELEERLQSLYGLKFVAVAESTMKDYQHAQFHPMNELLAIKASAVLPTFLAHSKVVAVGFGSALYTTSKTLNPARLDNDALFIPALGTTNSSTPQTQCNIIVDNFSSAFGARRYFTNVPIVLDQPEAESKLFPSRYGELVQHWNDADTVIVGLGVRYHETTDSFSLNEASEEYRATVAAEHSVGDILTRYFREDGSEIELDSTYVRAAISLERLSAIDRVLCIAGGPEKVHGIRTAIKSGYVNCLLTDMITACKLIELEEDSLQ